MACDDARGAALFSPDRNVAPRCPAFRSRYEVRGSRWLQALPAPAWVAATLLIVLLGTTALIWILDADGLLWSGREQLTIHVSMPDQMQLGVPATVEVLVKNTSGQKGSRWYLELTGSLCSNTLAEMSMPMPEPTSLTRDRDGKKFQLEYPPVKDWKKIRLFFRPKRAGEQTLDIKLYTSGLDPGRTINARTVVVDRSTGPVNAQKEDQTHER
ncbi:MAG: hypothetical protein BWY76_01648 [bacterium ADurb.Bin429]|nr:MAG: hypothetical protein BWY76_01648 [bacterium ADurb.Bin429]